MTVMCRGSDYTHVTSDYMYWYLAGDIARPLITRVDLMIMVIYIYLMLAMCQAYEKIDLEGFSNLYTRE